MLPKEILRKIRHIQFTTNRIVNDLFAGSYSSVFKGRGMEFDEVREYTPGDDVRSIDWNVTARTGKPFIKKYVEERELTIMLLLDLSGSQYFGSAVKTKSEIIAEIASIFAFSALKNNDKIGAVLFTDDTELYIPPRKSFSHVLRIIREVLYYKPRGKKTDIKQALEYFYHVQKKKCIAFLFSDFKDSGYEQALKVVNKKHDLVLLKVTDPREQAIPVPAYIELEDIETGSTVGVDFRPKPVREKFSQASREAEEGLVKLVKKYNIDIINIDAGRSYIEPLLKFFAKRESRRK